MLHQPKLLLIVFAIAFGAAAVRLEVAPVARASKVAASRVAGATPHVEQSRDADALTQATPKDHETDSKSQSTLTFRPPRMEGPSGQGRTTVSYAMEFRAGEEATVGAIRAIVTLPATSSSVVWKFVKAEPAPGSRLKISVQQQKKAKGRGSDVAESFELNITAGAHAIRNGVIGELQFSVGLVAKSSELPGSPVVKILSTSPPQTEQVGQPADKPFEMSPAAPANPGVSCFFFSH